MLGGDFVGEKELSVSHSLFCLLLSVCLSFCPVVSFASGVEAKSSGFPPLPSSHCYRKKQLFLFCFCLYTRNVRSQVCVEPFACDESEPEESPFRFTQRQPHTWETHVSSHEATFPQSRDHIHKCVSAALISQVSLPLEEQALISRFWFRAEALLVRMRAAVKHGCSNLHTKFSSKPSFVAHTVLALGCSFPL